MPDIKLGKKREYIERLTLNFWPMTVRPSGRPSSVACQGQTRTS